MPLTLGIINNIVKEGEDMFRNNEDGAALISVFFIIVILGLLVVSLSYSGLFDARMALRDEQNVQAYYLARSGIELTAALLQERPDLLLNEQLYVQGSLDEGFDISFIESSSHAPINIIVTSSSDGVGNHSGRIRATAFVGPSVSDTLEVRFKYTNSSLLLTEYPPLDALYGGYGGLGWYNETGGKGNLGRILPEEDSKSVNEPVKLGGEDSKEYTVLYAQGGGGEKGRHTLEAPAIYFIDRPNGFLVESNATMTLVGDYISILGNILLMDQGNSVGGLILRVYGAGFTNRLTGAKLNELGLNTLNGAAPESSTHYGALYIGGEGRRVNKDYNLLEQYNDITAGTYFFPNNMNFGSDSDRNKLIKAGNTLSLVTDLFHPQLSRKTDFKFENYQ